MQISEIAKLYLQASISFYSFIIHHFAGMLIISHLFCRTQLILSLGMLYATGNRNPIKKELSNKLISAVLSVVQITCLRASLFVFDSTDFALSVYWPRAQDGSDSRHHPEMSTIRRIRQLAFRKEVVLYNSPSILLTDIETGHSKLITLKRK